MVTAGAMVRGVMNRKINPIIPFKSSYFKYFLVWLIEYVLYTKETDKHFKE